MHTKKRKVWNVTSVLEQDKSLDTPASGLIMDTLIMWGSRLRNRSECFQWEIDPCLRNIHKQSIRQMEPSVWNSPSINLTTQEGMEGRGEGICVDLMLIYEWLYICVSFVELIGTFPGSDGACPTLWCGPLHETHHPRWTVTQRIWSKEKKRHQITFHWSWMFSYPWSFVFRWQIWCRKHSLTSWNTSLRAGKKEHLPPTDIMHTLS